MPLARAVNDKLRAESLRSESDEVQAFLLEINHPSLVEPIRLSSDMGGEVYGFDEETGDPIYCTRHQGNAYFAAPFSFIPPGSPDEDQMPQAKLTCGNIDPRIIQAIRNVHDRLTVDATVVYATDPDEAIDSMPRLWLMDVEYDAASITGTLEFRHFLNEPCPAKKFTPSSHPGLFAGGVVG